MKSVCPLCKETAEAAATPGDRKRYDCPKCGAFEITGTEETIVKADPAAAQSHRDRIARERKRGITIHRVG